MAMHWMGFDIEAMTKPKTPADVLAMLAELRSETEFLNEHLQKMLDEPTSDSSEAPPH